MSRRCAQTGRGTEIMPRAARCLIAVVLFVAMHSATGRAEIQIEPPQPTDTDPLQITASGWWRNPCFDLSSSVLVHGRRIDVAVAIIPLPVACVQVLGLWSVEHAIGPLPAGAYEVVITQNGIEVDRTTLHVRGRSAVGVSSCVGDCSGDFHVTIDELLRGVRMALGDQPSDSCPAFEAPVSIAQLVEAVGNALSECAESCGDGTVAGSEQCDDGNITGGDGCAANCTEEIFRVCTFEPESVVTVPGPTPIFGSIGGTVGLTVGTRRSSAGSVPLVVRSNGTHRLDGVQLDAVALSGIGCACMRGVADVEGGNIATGSTDCGGSPPDATRLDLGLSIVLLPEDDTCDSIGPREDGSCPYASYGADCLPCTGDDDPASGSGRRIELTTAQAGDLVGTPFDCDLLAGNPDAGIVLGVLVGSTDVAGGTARFVIACR